MFWNCCRIDAGLRLCFFLVLPRSHCLEPGPTLLWGHCSALCVRPYQKATCVQTHWSLFSLPQVKKFLNGQNNTGNIIYMVTLTLWSQYGMMLPSSLKSEPCMLFFSTGTNGEMLKREISHFNLTMAVCFFPQRTCIDNGCVLFPRRTCKSNHANCIESQQYGENQATCWAYMVTACLPI